MIQYGINELRVGLKVIQNQEPCVIISNEGVKPGKGLSFNRIRLKNIISGKILDRTLKSGDFLELADVVETQLIYLYRDYNLWYFMHDKNFDQVSIHKNIIGKSDKWMKEQWIYFVTFWNSMPILVTPPEIMHFKVVKTDLSIKSSSSTSTSSGNKLAILSTGAILKVPFFIKSGELIKVNTNTGTYISRMK
ncbi:elongation factor P [Candidatus Blochmanniella vafra str. BVAF]|uniref:Elongation factor P n=1 Tax=Blochmanniella vafra (strain BVAF) TaxID=859654 RepID=E8Q6P1_BLOVB|nr:elongation factor P [Candidatus Blochmannia vafer]ADV33482.1 elongation factor P [Candidatus Blochmannia vafer str. BVAF]